MALPKAGSGNAAGTRFASNPAKTRGRLLFEPPSRTRTEFQRDRDRIIHCRAFRRLKDKTQVFIYDEGDHFRTRLTHTIEVAQIARSLSRALGLNEDLAEALALAHDLGHPPFGHAGERALDACMKEYGGFDHNAQSLRVVTKLERSYATFDGLNLTWDMLEGLVKHNGPLTTREKKALGEEIPRAIIEFNEKCDLQLWSFASAEAQAAALADDIAYDAHDVDDGLRAGLFTIDDLKETLLGKEIVEDVDALYPGLEAPRRQHEVARRFITRLIEDVIFESMTRLQNLSGQGADAVRYASTPMIAFSENMAVQERELKNFLRARMYRHPRIMTVMENAQEGLSAIFNSYFNKRDILPPNWLEGADVVDMPRFARRVCDFLAGMTDRLALQEIDRLTNTKPDLRI
ncbi:MAG: deoxyguanosinetriphosphate triphosphohydrolase [Pseudomonadota bacterium]